MKDVFIVIKIGSSHARLLAARRNPAWVIDWCVTQPSRGVERGAIVSVEDAAAAVSGLLKLAAARYQATPREVLLALPAINLLSCNARCAVELAEEVRVQDICRIQEAFLAMVLPAEQRLVQVITRQYQLGQVVSRNIPFGRSGQRLHCDAHLVTVSEAAVRDTVNCLARNRVTVSGMYPQVLAAAEAVLAPEEMKFGSLVLQMGAGLTEFILYADGAPCMTGTLPFGGKDIVNAIARQFHTREETAATLLHTHGRALHLADEPDRVLPVAKIHHVRRARVTRAELNVVVEAMLEMALGRIRGHLEEAGVMGALGGSVVITGGLARIPYIDALAAEVFAAPARIGRVNDTLDPSGHANRPEFAPLVGVFRMALRRDQQPGLPELLHC